MLNANFDLLILWYQNIWIAETNPLRRSMLEKMGNFTTYDPTKPSQCPPKVDIAKVTHVIKKPYEWHETSRNKHITKKYSNGI